QFFNNQYYLYYTTNGTQTPGRGSAIGVVTSPNPTGPWTDSGGPVVEPQPSPLGGRAGRWVYDPAVVTDSAGQRYRFYGIFVGGVLARPLSADGLRTDPATEVPIAAANRYEGVSIVRRNGYYYLFASAGECCNGPLSGYSVLVGRATEILGPYTDREGISLLAGQVGGTPVLGANGNRWIGPGHNTVFTDLAGQDWFLYHAVDRDDPYFAGTNITKRPPLLDRLDWSDGWPVVRGGLGPSDTPQPVPAAQPGDAPRPAIDALPGEILGRLDSARSIDFSALPAGAIGADPAFPSGLWHWVRPPAANSVGLIDGTLRFPTQAGSLADHSAGILTEPEPAGDYIVETRVRLDLPPDGCCQNSVQAGLVIYGDDGNYLKLAHLSREQTRQVIFTKTVDPVPPRFPREGNTVVGPADAWTYLRIVKRIRNGEETYTAYSSRDGVAWTRGGTWNDALGRDARIGLVSMGGAGFTANFDYVRVYALPPE
ncbi:MAG: family 43 glycosylhydrolase, partial [Thermomicrobiales bacterium]